MRNSELTFNQLIDDDEIPSDEKQAIATVEVARAISRLVNLLENNELYLTAKVAKVKA